MTTLLQRFFNVRREEVAPILVAALYFFCVLTATQVLRSARDAIGMRGGLDEVRWLFVGTAVVTLGENQITGDSGIGWELTGSFPRLNSEQPTPDKRSASTTQKEMKRRHGGKRTISIWSLLTFWLYRNSHRRHNQRRYIDSMFPLG